MEAAFTQFRIYDLHAKGEALAEIDVYMGQAPKVRVSLTQDIQKGLAVIDRKGVKSEIIHNTAKAPIVKGEVVAQLKVTLPGRLDETYDLVAMDDVKRKGVFARAWAGLLGHSRSRAGGYI